MGNCAFPGICDLFEIQIIIQVKTKGSQKQKSALDIEKFMLLILYILF
jgi:hypothetical protein